MDFGQALQAAKRGVKIQRQGWNGKGMWVELQVPDAQSKMGHPYLYMKGVDGKLPTPRSCSMARCKVSDAR